MKNKIFLKIIQACDELDIEIAGFANYPGIREFSMQYRIYNKQFSINLSYNSINDIREILSTIKQSYESNIQEPAIAQ